MQDTIDEQRAQDRADLEASLRLFLDHVDGLAPQPSTDTVVTRVRPHRTAHRS